MIDDIGTLYAQTEDGPRALFGHHINVTQAYFAQNPELRPFLQSPAQLRVTWAGDCPENPTDTVPLRFDTVSDFPPSLQRDLAAMIPSEE